MFLARFSDAVLGVVMVVFSLLLMFVIIPISVQVPKSNKVLALSPDFWIKIIVFIIFTVSIYLVFHGLYSSKHQISSDELEIIKTSKAGHHSISHAILLCVTAILNLFLYFFLIKWLGMMLASAISIMTFTLLSGERRVYIMLPIAFLIPVGLYYFFLKVASIPMPLGIFS